MKHGASAQNEKPFACVIVGAGEGKRFGARKADARLPDGTRFVDAVASAADAAGAVPVVVVLPAGVTPPKHVRHVVNPRQDAEQIDSLRLGLAQLANTAVDGALLWPVDHPFVGAQTVRAVVTAARSSGAEIGVPVCDGRRGHPTYFARAVWPELMTVESGGARTVVRLDPSRVAEVAVRDAGVLADIDTRPDLARAATALS